MTEVKSGRKIQSMTRAVSILEHIATNGNSDSLSNISRTLGLSKSTVFTLISTWEQLGYVKQNQDNGKYSLGLKLFEMGQIVHSSMDLRMIAMPFLRELAGRYEETVHLAVLSGDEVVYIDKVDSPRSIGIVSKIGGRNPAYCTGVGKILLSGLSDDQVDKLFDGKKLQQFTANTITSPVELKRHLRKIRMEGYTLDREEIEMGLVCVAAPIKNYQGTIIAAVSLSGPVARMGDSMERITSDIKETAGKVSREFGLS